MHHRGFTIVELIIVITIMAILMTLGVVNLRNAQVNARDTERKTDISTIAKYLEVYYTSGNNSTSTALPDCTSRTVTHDGAYTVNTFTSSGTLTCTSNFNATALIVAGGGAGGGEYDGGGGGAGGLLRETLTLSGSMRGAVAA
jgi:prepilin-type N-terminal cleavage/methylation domain-containing protein